MPPSDYILFIIMKMRGLSIILKDFILMIIFNIFFIIICYNKVILTIRWFMKKFRTFIFLILVACCGIFVGCADAQTSVCDEFGHLWEVLSQVDPTCTESGEQTRKCEDCDFEETIILEPLGHVLGENQELEYSESHGYGEVTGYCTRCHQQDVTLNVKPVTNTKTWTVEEIPATFLKKGESVYKSKYGIVRIETTDKLHSYFYGGIHYSSASQTAEGKEGNYQFNYRIEPGTRSVIIPYMLCGDFCLEREGKGFISTIADVVDEITFEEGWQTIEDGMLRDSRGSGFKKVNLPSTIKTIAENAFAVCYNLESINLQNVETIGKNAFFACNKLTTVEFSQNLTSIGEGAFKQTKLNELPYIKTLKTIGDSAFEGANLKKVKLPYCMKTIGDLAFKNNPALSEFVFIKSDDFAGECNIMLGANLFDETDNITKVILPDGLKEIPDDFLKNKSEVSQLYLPDSVEIVGKYSFSGLSGIVGKFELPANLKIIKDGAFSYFKGNITAIPDGVVEIGASSFHNCQNSTFETISNNLTTIPDYAFNMCTSASFQKLPENLATIGNFSFNYCTALEVDSLPINLTEIGDRAFNACENITISSMPWKLKTLGFGAFDGCKKITVSKLPPELTKIEGCAFAGCESITEIEIGNNVVSIGYDAFKEIKNLQKVQIGNKVEIIEQNAFYYCINLTFVNMGGSVKKIENRAFFGCRNLEDLALSENLEEIGDEAFYQCRKINNWYLPAKLKVVGDGAFRSCSSLELTELPNQLETIGDKAFYYCAKIKISNIPYSVKTIGNEAFGHCSNITEIVIGKNVETFGTKIFDECLSLIKIYWQSVTPITVDIIGSSYNNDNLVIEIE